MSVSTTTLSTFQDLIIRESERQLITSISRSQAYQLKKIDRFPKRIVLGRRSVGWRLSDINLTSCNGSTTANEANQYAKVKTAAPLSRSCQ